jgi:hypothetical protein
VLAIEDNDIQEALSAGAVGRRKDDSDSRDSNLRGTSTLALTRAAGLAGTGSSTTAAFPHPAARPMQPTRLAEAKTLSGRALQSWGKAKRLSHQGCIRALH